MSTMRFRNFGGIHQFMVTDEDDLARIDELDPARWAATSAPVAGLNCDAIFLKYIDPETSGRVRVSQIVEARDWLFARLAKRDVVRKPVEAIAVEAIDGKGEAGLGLRAVAERINREQKVADPKAIALSDIQEFKGGYQKLLANGDGVIPADVVPEEDVKAFIGDVIDVVGSVPDRGGSNGVNAELLEKFMKQGALWSEWRSKAAAAKVWGDDTEAAVALVREMDPKLEAYFLHGELLRQETPTPESLRLKDDDLRALRLKTAEDIERYLQGSPLAQPVPGGELSLSAAINALYSDRFDKLRETVIARALGSGVTSISRADWRKVRATFDGYVEWEKGRPPENFEKLGEEKVRAHLDGKAKAKVDEYLELDKAAAKEIGQVDDLEKLLLYVRWLVELVNNFVNFSAIYLPKETALVETGSLVIDGRRLDFCMRVGNRAEHKAVASLSFIYLVYVELFEKEGGASAGQLVAPVTGGEVGRLRVGKRGIFIDLDGKELDAVVSEIVDNPISVKQAAFAPFRRVAAMVSSKIEEYVASAQASQEAAMTARAEAGVAEAQATAERGAAQVGTGVDVARGTAAPPPPPAPPPAPAARPASEPLNVNSLVLGGGMALGGISVVLGALFGALKEPSFWGAVLGVVLLVMAISALLGWLKLRKRDLALLLEAGGWAVNIHMNITRRVARVFAFTPDLPKDAKLDQTDMLPGSPEDEDHTARNVVVFILLAAAAAALWVYRRKLGLTEH